MNFYCSSLTLFLDAVISDPREYMKIIRQEGKYPSGLLESLWPMQKSLQAIDAALIRGEDKGFFGRGVDWKRIRNFLVSKALIARS